MEEGNPRYTYGHNTGAGSPPSANQTDTRTAGDRQTNTGKRKGKRRQRKGRSTVQGTASQPESTQKSPSTEPSFDSLVEDITCSICLEELKDPVYIACGHTFCRSCISTHWSTQHPQGYFCPECRAVCPRNHLVPDYRLANLISKIKQGVQEKNIKQDTSALMDPDHPIQLVRTDGSGRLRLQDSVLYDCFLNSEYALYPAFLLCVIGEKRRGKSFLLNYIMRALRSQEKGEELSLGADDDPLKGFDWKPGTDSTTKGIWIWNRPFILDYGGEKVAVYVLDSEGSLEIENGRETCIKLSALSMILSSHLIFNVASSLKETELDYMEMYLNMGEEYESQNLQYLDILVRDWYDSKKCDRDSARSYINREIEKLQKITRYPKVLETLKSSLTRCYLLPHPGKELTGESQGWLQDMDTDFQLNLKEYVFDVVNGIRYRLKVDRYGNVLTCAHIPAMLQEFMEILDQQIYGFSSPMEMFYALKNHKTREDIEKQFHDFLANQSSFTLPSTMRTQVSEMSSVLIEEFKESRLGHNVAHQDILLEELQSNLYKEQEKFCNNYTKRFTMGAVGVGLTAGLGVYGVVGAAAAKGAVVLATQPQAVATEGAVAMQLANVAVSLVKTGFGAMAGRFFR